MRARDRSGVVLRGGGLVWCVSPRSSCLIPAAQPAADHPHRDILYCTPTTGSHHDHKIPTIILSSAASVCTTALMQDAGAYYRAILWTCLLRMMSTIRVRLLRYSIGNAILVAAAQYSITVVNAVYY